jgi:hypothetical protein
MNPKLRAFAASRETFPLILKAKRKTPAAMAQQGFFFVSSGSGKRRSDELF